MRVKDKKNICLTLLMIFSTVLFANQQEVSVDIIEGGEDFQADSNDKANVAQEIGEGIKIEDIVEPPADYRYAAFGQNDPFVHPEFSRDFSDEATDIPIVSSLQKFRLVQLKIVGVWILKNNDRKAMVLTPDGEGIIVRIGDTIGKNNGKIFDILTDRVIVRSFRISPDGTRKFDDSDLFLAKAAKTDTRSKEISGQILREKVSNLTGGQQSQMKAKGVQTNQGSTNSVNENSQPSVPATPNSSSKEKQQTNPAEIIKSEEFKVLYNAIQNP